VHRAVICSAKTSRGHSTVQRGRGRAPCDLPIRYGQSCAIAHGLELIGARWAALVLFELAREPRRFSELRENLKGVSANVLSRRLTELQSFGLVQKVPDEDDSLKSYYEATAWAVELTPLLEDLSAWASRSPRTGSPNP
jgi:DNA-binding HxlR family transcriptional regulator